MGVHFGAGQHIAVIIQKHPEWLTPFLKYIYAVEILYVFIIAPLKCSICCLYIRLFGINRPFRYYCYLIIALTTGWALATLFGSVFQCIPVEEAWNPMSDRTMCVDLKKFLIGTNTPNVILDFMVLTAPLRPIWQLKLPTAKKILITSVLLLGAG